MTSDRVTGDYPIPWDDTFPLDVVPCIIPLDNYCNRWAIVDAELYPVLTQWLWHANLDGRCNTCYAVRKVARREGGKRVVKSIYMHRWIMKDVPRPSDEHVVVVDHINCDPLDNRRANLRWATLGENNRNRLGLTIMSHAQMELIL